MHSVGSVGDHNLGVFTITEIALNRQRGLANKLYLRGAKHGLRRLVKAPPFGYAVDLLCAARPRAIVVYRTSRKFQDAIVKHKRGAAPNDYRLGSGVSRLPI